MTKIKSIVVAGRSSFFGVLFPFCAIVLVGIILIEENNWGILSYVVTIALGVLIEFTFFSNIYYKFYLYEDRIVRKFPLAAWISQWVCLIKEIKYIEYIGNVSRYTPPAVLKIYRIDGDYRAFDFNDYDRKELKKFVRYMMKNGVEVRNRYTSHKIEDVLKTF